MSQILAVRSRPLYIILSLLMAMGHDFMSKRKIHAVYIFGVIAFLARVFSVLPVVNTESWHSFSQFVFRIYGAV